MLTPAAASSTPWASTNLIENDGTVGQVACVEGDFYAEPQPDVTLSEADHEQFERKLAYETEHLDAWLG